MSIHRSLRTVGALSKHRNVLTRRERLERLEGEERWNEEENSVLGLPKVKNLKLKAKKKAKKDEKEGEGEGEAATEGGASADAAKK